jgi:hypothetical protein
LNFLFHPVGLQDKLDFLHLPIIDGNVTSDTALSRLADDCCARLLRGERLYIHWCVGWGCRRARKAPVGLSCPPPPARHLIRLALLC